MSISYVQTISLSKSRSYVRLSLSFCLLALGLVLVSGLYLLVKLFLIAYIYSLFRAVHQNPNPCPLIQEIRLLSDQWVLTLTDGQHQSYEFRSILIHNPVFQIIKLSSTNKNKILILFNDQIPTQQLRLLHLNQSQNSI